MLSHTPAAITTRELMHALGKSPAQEELTKRFTRLTHSRRAPSTPTMLLRANHLTRQVFQGWLPSRSGSMSAPVLATLLNKFFREGPSRLVHNIRMHSTMGGPSEVPALCCRHVRVLKGSKCQAEPVLRGGHHPALPRATPSSFHTVHFER